MSNGDDDDLTKADQFGMELSRWGPGSGHAPSFSTEKLRRLAASGLGENAAMQLAVTRMMRADGSEDPRLRPTPHVVSVDDVTRGLGLEAGDDQRVQRLVTDSVVRSTQKTQTQHLMHARGRLLSTMRDNMPQIAADARDEITRRAIAYWRRNEQTDYGKAPTVRFRGGEMTKAIPVLLLRKALAPRGPSLVIPFDVLEKGQARGGKYYRRVPYTDGKGHRRYRYYYTKKDYERAYGDEHHAHGPDVLEERQKAQSAREHVVSLVQTVRGLIEKLRGTDSRTAAEIGRMAQAKLQAYQQKNPQQFGPDMAPRASEAYAAVQRIYGEAAQHLYRELAPTTPPRVVLAVGGRSKKRPEPSPQLGFDFAGVQEAAAPGGESVVATPAPAAPTADVALIENGESWQTSSSGERYWQSPSGIYRVYVDDKGRAELHTKKYNRDTKRHSWEASRRGFTGTPAEVTAEAQRREAVIARRDNERKGRGEVEVTSGPSGPSGPSGEGTRVGGNTYTVRNTIKAHGGKWDKATKTWIVPTDRVEALKAALGSAAGKLSFDSVEAATVEAPTPAQEPQPAEPEVQPPPVQAAPPPPASATVSHEQLRIEAENLAKQLGLKSTVSARKGPAHAIMGQSIDISVRSSGKAFQDGKALSQALAKRWVVSKPIGYQEVRIGNSYGTSGHYDGTVLTLRVYPDMEPGSTASNPTLRPDAERGMPTGNPERGRGVANRVSELLRTGDAGDRSLAIDVVAALVKDGDVLAQHAAYSALMERYKVVQAREKELMPHRHGKSKEEYVRVGNEEHALRRDILYMLRRALEAAPPPKATPAPAETASGPSGPSGPSGEPGEVSGDIARMDRAQLEQAIHENGIRIKNADYMSTDQLREAVGAWIEAGDEIGTTKVITQTVAIGEPPTKQAASEAPVPAAVSGGPKGTFTMSTDSGLWPLLEKIGLVSTNADVGYTRAEYMGTLAQLRAAIANLELARAAATGAEKTSIGKLIGRIQMAADSVDPAVKAARERKSKLIGEALETGAFPKGTDYTKLSAEEIEAGIARKRQEQVTSTTNVVHHPGGGRTVTTPSPTGGEKVTTFDASGAIVSSEYRFSDRDRQQMRDEARAKLAKIHELRRQNLSILINKGDILTVNGKKYRAASGEREFGRHGRVVALEPVGGRATAPRELQISAKGDAEIRVGAKREAVTSIEGGTQRETPWTPPAEPPKVADPLPPAPPTPPRPDPLPPEPPKSPRPTTTQKPPAGSPRAAAAAETKRMQEESEYANDRASAVEMRGEDVMDSARHRAIEWKGAREASRSEHADKMFTRDFLMRQEPTDFIGRVQKDPSTAINALVLYLTAKKFPGKPDLLEKPPLGWTIAYNGNQAFKRKIGSNTGFSSYGHSGYHAESGENAEEVSYDEYVRRSRESYYEAYSTVKGIIDTHLAKPPSADPRDLRRSLIADLRAAYDRRMASHGHNDAGLEALRAVYNGLGGMKKTSPLMQAADFANRLAKAYPDAAERTKKGPEHIIDVLEGKSFNATFDTVQNKEGRLDVSQFYNTSQMKRKGPPSEYQSIEQGLNLLDKNTGGKYQMRAIQWGKSVTDQERAHHLKSVVDSMADLTEVLGLPPAMGSFNGRLALAIGARGVGGAMAHYEPMLRVINLTRKKGAGALAHEWGHFFDHTIAQLTRTGSDSAMAALNLKSAGPVIDQMKALVQSPQWQSFTEKCQKLAANMPAGPGAEYWASREELFARVFERHIQRKLHKAGRENTYLTGIMQQMSPMWPSDAESDAFEPLIDSIFEAFRNSPLLEKALALLSRPLVRAEYAHLVGSKLVVRR